MEELTLTVRRARGHRGRRYEIVSMDGRVLGDLGVHVMRPNAFDTEGLDLRLTTSGVLSPRHVARRTHGGETVAVLRHGPIPGRIRLRFRGESSIPLGMRGILRPQLVLPAEAELPALEFRPSGLTGPEGRAKLRPSDAWPKDRLLVALALLLQARLRSHTVLA